MGNVDAGIEQTHMREPKPGQQSGGEKKEDTFSCLSDSQHPSSDHGLQEIGSDRRFPEPRLRSEDCPPPLRLPGLRTPLSVSGKNASARIRFFPAPLSAWSELSK